MGLKPILVLIIVLILSILTIFNVHPRYRYFSFFDKVMSFDIGYSAPSEFNGRSYELLFKILINSPYIIWENIKGFPERPHVERIDLDVKFLDYQQILMDKKKAISEQILVSPSEVKGKIRNQDRSYKAKLRLKGDLAQHWRSKHRMSLRVSLRGKNTILNYKRFSIHKPSARQHPFDQTFQALVRRMGNIAPEHTYANVFMNGSNWGLMNIEEHMSKEMLEKQRRKESLIIRFGNEDKWVYKKKVDAPYKGYKISDAVLNINVYGEKKYLQTPIYRKWMSYIANQRLLINDTSLYDIDSYSRTLFLTAIWNNSHTLSHANSRQYFNPYTLRLEPITTDQGMFYDLKQSKEYSLTQDIYKQIVVTEKYKNNLRDNIESVANVIPAIDEELNFYQSYFPLDAKIKGSIVKENLKLILSDPESYLIPNDRADKKNIEKLNKAILPNDEQAVEFPVHLYARHFEDGRIDLYNLLPDKVKLIALILDGNSIDTNAIDVAGYLPGQYTPSTLNTSLKGIYDNRLSIETEYKGNRRISDVSSTHLSKEILNPLNFETTSSFSFLKNKGINDWFIPSGQWYIDEPLVINGTLTLAAGAHLRFSDNAYMIIKGGSLQAEGEEANQIVMEPSEKTWKGLYVLEANKSSKLKHVVIKGASETEHEILKLTGGTTFYKSNVNMKNVDILNGQAEDALNIINSTFTIDNVTINGAISDGFDSDFSNGEIIDSDFLNIEGDAVDFSGSRVQIKNVRISDVHDKAVSVGESSEVEVSNSTIKRVGVGIASKDGSRATARNVSISSFELSAAMAYIKKDFFGMPNLALENCSVEDSNSAYISQVGTTLTVDNKIITPKILDVDKLYQESVMKK
jgi:Right handed beta helix region